MVTTVPSKHTRADYMRLPEGYPAQLVDGCIVKEPSPTIWHQWIVRRLLFAFQRHVGEERILPSPLDLFLDDENIFQPDVLVFERPLRVRPEDREVEMPVLVAEVLSPSTAARDRGVKTDRYIASGVREVWLVDPREGTIEVVSAGGSRLAVAGEVARSDAVPGFAIEVDRLFKT
jgi:Uma2 family endonuclease